MFPPYGGVIEFPLSEKLVIISLCGAISDHRKE